MTFTDIFQWFSPMRALAPAPSDTRTTMQKNRCRNAWPSGHQTAYKRSVQLSSHGLDSWQLSYCAPGRPRLGRAGSPGAAAPQPSGLPARAARRAASQASPGLRACSGPRSRRRPRLAPRAASREAQGQRARRRFQGRCPGHFFNLCRIQCCQSQALPTRLVRGPEQGKVVLEAPVRRPEAGWLRQGV